MGKCEGVGWTDVLKCGDGIEGLCRMVGEGGGGGV